MNIYRVVSLSALISLATLTPSSAFADTIQISYSAAGVQAPTTTPYYDTFGTTSASYTPSSTPLTTTFGGSGITGTYTGTYNLAPAGSYGGAGGTGEYLQVTGGNSVTLTLSTNVNYFGLWFSALDQYNELSFYNVPTNGTANSSDEVLDFTPQAFITAVGSCPNSSNAYCGNPNNGQDLQEQFAYLNFLDTTGTFNTIVIAEQPNTNTSAFEADNEAVAVSGQSTGTLLPTPEPSSLALLGTGLATLAGVVRRRKN